MPLVQCTGCKRFVLPKSDDSCPSCGAAAAALRKRGQTFTARWLDDS